MRVGLDIGSTTIKCVVLNDAGQIVYSTYERHFSHILEKGRALLEKVAAEYLPDGRARRRRQDHRSGRQRPLLRLVGGAELLLDPARSRGEDLQQAGAFLPHQGASGG